MEFLEIKEEEFDRFAEGHELANLWQTSDMADLRCLNNWKKSYVGVKENGKLIAGTMLSHRPLFLGYEVFQSLRGYLIDFQNESLFNFFHEHLIAYLKQNKCLYIHVDPYLPYIEHDINGNIVPEGFDNKNVVEHMKSLGYRHYGFTTGYSNQCEPRWIYTIHMENETEKSLFDKMERKAKRSILKTEKYKIRLRFLDEDIHEFENIMVHTSERRGFENRDHSYYQNLNAIYGKRDHLKFLVAELVVDDYIASLNEDKVIEEKKLEDCHMKLEKSPNSPKIMRQQEQCLELLEGIDKKIEEAEGLKAEKGNVIQLAAGLFFTYGNEILCLFSGVYDEYMKFAAPYAMHWYMMKYGMEHGKKRYNLYGITGNFDKNDEGYGVYEFKRGFQGEVIELIGDFDYIVNPFVYSIYKNLKKVKSLVRGS